jgi:hypothetical protein
MISEHKKAITALVDATEAVLTALEKHKIDPDQLAEKSEFKVLVHLLKMVIDSQFNIPNELNERLNEFSEDFGLDNLVKKTVH